MESITDGWVNWISEWGEVLILIGMKIRNSPSHDMLARVGGVPWDSLLSFPMDWEAGLKCAQVGKILPESRSPVLTKKHFQTAPEVVMQMLLTR